MVKYAISLNLSLITLKRIFSNGQNDHREMITSTIAFLCTKYNLCIIFLRILFGKRAAGRPIILRPRSRVLFWAGRFPSTYGMCGDYQTKLLETRFHPRQVGHHNGGDEGDCRAALAAPCQETSRRPICLSLHPVKNTLIFLLGLKVFVSE